MVQFEELSKGEGNRRGSLKKANDKTMLIF